MGRVLRPWEGGDPRSFEHAQPVQAKASAMDPLPRLLIRRLIVRKVGGLLRLMGVWRLVLFVVADTRDRPHRTEIIEGMAAPKRHWALS
jgi:hypothetical protein